ncbi:MAG: hypothetical protein LBC86_00575, partial [Oscillospiraceae bacterium]|nr:hypothetical protein [Oscillospiraceae bacterium]
MKKVFLCLLIVCVFLAGSRDSASPFNGLDLEPNPAPDLESEPTPLFYLDYAYNFTEEDLQGRIPIFFDGGDERMERMIFFADTDLHDLKFHRWDGWDVIDEESVAYLGDFLFSVE